jgi:hypothetical protein
VSRKRTAPESAPLPRFAETPGPAAHGHVMWYDGEQYRRVQVRVPLELVGELAAGPISPPDHRSTTVAHMQRELMSDAMLGAIHRDKGTLP